MKKLLFLLTISIFSTTISFAKIWRVANGAAPGDFTTAQAAHNAASVGDSIYLEPSFTNYGDLITSKRLIWISTGNFLNVHPELQYSQYPGALNNIAINAGSEASVFSIKANYMQCNTSNVRFLRCYIGTGIVLSNSSDASITGCFIFGSISVQSSNNVIISNNIIYYGITVDYSANAIIINNNINFREYTTSTIFNSMLQNNIFIYGSNSVFTNCNINNNISTYNIFPAGNGNQTNVDMGTVFINAIIDQSTDADFVLKPGSPAIGTGYGGVDMGAFGGNTPFVLGLQPGIPAIYQISAPAAPTGSTMNVTFSTRSNN